MTYQQTPAGAARDMVARYVWAEELDDRDRKALRRAGFHLSESCRQFGDVMLAELLFAIVQGGYMEEEKA